MSPFSVQRRAELLLDDAGAVVLFAPAGTAAGRQMTHQIMRTMCVVAVIVLAASAVAGGAERHEALDVKSDPHQVAQLLARLDVWMLPQPKRAAATGSAFDLKRCAGIRLVGEAGKLESLAKDFSDKLPVR